MIEFIEGMNQISEGWVNAEGCEQIYGVKCYECKSACLGIAKWDRGTLYRCPICHKGVLRLNS